MASFEALREAPRLAFALGPRFHLRLRRHRFALRFPALVVGMLAASSLAIASNADVPRAPARSGEPGAPVLVELFTSQGCSSCPAADALVRELPRLGFNRDRVIPLTFHVDYWDDLGWKDPFATSGFTERQRHYTEAGTLTAPPGEDGIRGAYTPQMIVNGSVHFSGARRDRALVELARAAMTPAPATLTASATIDGDRAAVAAALSLNLAAPGNRGPLSGWTLTVALAQKSARTRVSRGENSGETLEEAAVVRALSSPIAVTTVAAIPMQVSIAKPTELTWDAVELTAFVQDARSGRVVAARAIPIPVRTSKP